MNSHLGRRQAEGRGETSDHLAQVSEGQGISAKGQISLPKEVREALGLSVGDRVAFAVQGGAATLLPLRTRTAEALCGALSHLAKPLDLEELRARRAEEVAAKLCGEPRA